MTTSLQADHADWADQLARAMDAAGIETAPDNIIADGQLHRFGYKNNSWYVVHPDPIAPTWSFGDWRLGFKESGQGNPGRVLTREEVRERRRQIAEQRALAAAQKAEQEASAALQAQERWSLAQPAPAEHPYLVRKGIEPCGTRLEGHNLLVPFYDADGTILALQAIAPNGTKDNQRGARRHGCFYPIGSINEPNRIAVDAPLIVIGEGFSTCATVFMACGGLVVSAGTAGEMERAAMAMRRLHPTATIVLAADDDWLVKVKGKPKNAGKLAATAAAAAVGGVLAMPWFHPSGRPTWATDYNDMASLYGIDEVRTCIRLAVIAWAEGKQRVETVAPQKGAVAEQGADKPKAGAPQKIGGRSCLRRPGIPGIYGLLRAVANETAKPARKLFWATCKVRDLVASGEFDRATGDLALDCLREAAARAALPDADISTIINRALSA